jgi:hypothetical protein
MNVSLLMKDGRCESINSSVLIRKGVRDSIIYEEARPLPSRGRKFLISCVNPITVFFAASSSAQTTTSRSRINSIFASFRAETL